MLVLYSHSNCNHNSSSKTKESIRAYLCEIHMNRRLNYRALLKTRDQSDVNDLTRFSMPSGFVVAIDLVFFWKTTINQNGSIDGKEGDARVQTVEKGDDHHSNYRVHC